MDRGTEYSVLSTCDILNILNPHQEQQAEMASDPQATGLVPPKDVPASDYQTVPKPAPRVSEAARFPAGCMIWLVLIGMSILVGIMLCWGISNLHTIAWDKIFG